MKYYIREVQNTENSQKTAGGKAREDVEQILLADGYQTISVNVPSGNRKESSPLKKVSYHFELKKEWDRSLGKLKKGDIVLIQVPIINHSILLSETVKKLRKRGVICITLIHDLEILRAILRKEYKLSQRIRMQLEEKSILKSCNYIIAHNEKMKAQLIQLGLDSEKIYVLEIFDYLLDDSAGYSKTGKDLPVVIAGALKRHKAGYAYQLGDVQNYNLYGINYDDQPRNNIHYFGSFYPSELTGKMEGSFGLVWDGNSTETCAGIFGEYLRVNNPHKTSLYLASGLPVFIWEEAALAGFIKQNKCGLTIHSLSDIPGVLSGLTENEYQELITNTRNISKQLRRGAYTLKVLNQILERSIK